MEIDESLEQAAYRELQEETGLNDIPLAQIHTFSDPERDPRGRVISTCFAGLLTGLNGVNLGAASDAANLGCFDINHLPDLAFDHQQIIKTARDIYLKN